MEYFQRIKLKLATWKEANVNFENRNSLKFDTLMDTGKSNVKRRIIKNDQKLKYFQRIKLKFATWKETDVNFEKRKQSEICHFDGHW